MCYRQTIQQLAIHVCFSRLFADFLVYLGLVGNPNEVVTVLLVNGADASASDLATEYQQAGISDIAYTPTSSSSSSYDWPTLQSLINNGTRLLNFVATLSDNSGASYLMNEFDYVRRTKSHAFCMYSDETWLDLREQLRERCADPVLVCRESTIQRCQ